jgi:hypothetical protein
MILWTDPARRDDRLIARLGFEACAYRELLERALEHWGAALCEARKEDARHQRLLADFRRLQTGAPRVE